MSLPLNSADVELPLERAFDRNSGKIAQGGDELRDSLRLRRGVDQMI
jgi:hypothetical protein